MPPLNILSGCSCETRGLSSPRTRAGEWEGLRCPGQNSVLSACSLGAGLQGPHPCTAAPARARPRPLPPLPVLTEWERRLSRFSSCRASRASWATRSSTVAGPPRLGSAAERTVSRASGTGPLAVQDLVGSPVLQGHRQAAPPQGRGRAMGEPTPPHTWSPAAGHQPQCTPVSPNPGPWPPACACALKPSGPAVGPTSAASRARTPGTPFRPFPSGS